MFGKVKFFNKEKGFGFIKNNAGVDHFVHYSEINMDGFKDLDEDMEVEFEAADGDKGPVAKNVTLV